MFPILADRLISSLKLTDEILKQFSVKCVATIRVNEERCRELLERSSAYATLLAPVLGYDTVSAIVKESLKTGSSIRTLVLSKKLLSEAKFDEAVQ